MLNYFFKSSEQQGKDDLEEGETPGQELPEHVPWDGDEIPSGPEGEIKELVWEPKENLGELVNPLDEWEDRKPEFEPCSPNPWDGKYIGPPSTDHGTNVVEKNFYDSGGGISGGGVVLTLDGGGPGGEVDYIVDVEIGEEVFH